MHWGALEFFPPQYSDVAAEIISVQELYRSSKEALAGRHDFALAPLIAVSNSAGGGAHAKAIVGFNPATDAIHIGAKQAELPEGFVPAIIKFDEFHGGHPWRPKSLTDASVYMKTEYLYAQVAAACGITMAPSWIVENGEGAHFVTPRFDRDGASRRHMHSLSGLLHHDAARPMTLGYEMLFRVGVALGVCVEHFTQMFRIMVFNLLLGNRDDHSKNFSFLYDPAAGWSFAPAYDLTFVINRGASQEHQLTIDGRPASWAGRRKLEAIAVKFGVKNPGMIIDEIREAKHTMLPDLMARHALPKVWQDEIFDKTAEVDHHLTKGTA